MLLDSKPVTCRLRHPPLRASVEIMVERLGDGVETFRKLNQCVEVDFETPWLDCDVRGKGRHRRIGYFIGDNVAQFPPDLAGLFRTNSFNLARYVVGHGKSLEKMRKRLTLDQERAPQPN